MLVSFNWLKELVDIKGGAEALAEKLTMSGFEVESISKSGDDSILDVNVTPNRGDCLSHIGIAREVAAVVGKKFEACPEQSRRGRRQTKISEPKLEVEIRDKKRCLRYCAMIISGVKIAPSPAWISSRLASCGIQSINNVVDATNYMMLLTGQPFHAFDYRYIRGGKIIVTTPPSETSFTTLDGVTRKLSEEDLLICDAGGPVAIAGVMGGANSEIRGDTVTIVLESACFNPITVRKTSKKLGLSSESSKRFERGVDADGSADSIKKLADLITKIAGSVKSQDLVDIYPRPVKKAKVKFSVNYANSLLGMVIKPQNVKNYFRYLGISYSRGVCTIPTWRQDLTRPADLVEEVARLHGYDKIPLTLPAFTMSGLSRPTHSIADEAARKFLAAHGFYEAVNYGFCSPLELAPFSKEPVTISNPLGVEFSAMKTSLIPGLINNIKLNVNFGQDSFKLFELRPVFSMQGASVIEKKMLGGIMYREKSDPADFYYVKGVCAALLEFIGLTNVGFSKSAGREFMHPNASCKIMRGEKEIGICGILHPSIGKASIFELNWEEAAKAGETRKFKALERFPSVRRDVALMVSEDILSEDIQNVIAKFGSRIIKNAAPFDVYKGKGIPEGKKSIAYAVMYSNSDRTLTDEEVNKEHAGLVSFLKNKLGAEIR